MYYYLVLKKKLRLSRSNHAQILNQYKKDYKSENMFKDMYNDKLYT